MHAGSGTTRAPEPTARSLLLLALLALLLVLLLRHGSPPFGKQPTHRRIVEERTLIAWAAPIPPPEGVRREGPPDATLTSRRRSLFTCGWYPTSRRLEGTVTQQDTAGRGDRSRFRWRRRPVGQPDTAGDSIGASVVDLAQRRPVGPASSPQSWDLLSDLSDVRVVYDEFD